MTDDNTIGVGDICTYSYDNDNKSLSIVEVVKEFSDEVLVVKFLQVIIDDSGNGLFTYLHKTARTMNVSKKYLHKILLINRQKAEIESVRKMNFVYFERNKSLAEAVKILETRLCHAKAEAIKEFAEFLKSKATAIHKSIDGNYLYELSNNFIDNLVKEMVGDTE